MAETQEKEKKGPSTGSKVGNTLLDVLLPAFAFAASASGPYGQAGASTLLQALNVGENRRRGRRADERAQAQFDAQAPQRENQQAKFQFENDRLQDIMSSLGATVPSAAAEQSLGAEQTGRLQEALGRGEQAPLPQDPPSPELQQERFQQIPTDLIAAAGLKDVATQRNKQTEQTVDVANVERQITRDQAKQNIEERKFAFEQEKAGKEEQDRFARVKIDAIKDFNAFAPENFPTGEYDRYQSRMAAAKDAPELAGIVSTLPAGTLRTKQGWQQMYEFHSRQMEELGQDPGTLQDFINKGKSLSAAKISIKNNSTDDGVHWGDPPKGHAWLREADGSMKTAYNEEQDGFTAVAVPIKGGAEYRKIEEDIAKGQASKEKAVQMASMTINDINKSLEIMDNSPIPVAGLIGGALSRFGPSTPPYDVRSLISGIGGRISLKELRELKEAGGTLGLVTEPEHRMLQSIYGSLGQFQDEDLLRRNLHRLREVYLDVVQGTNRPDRQEKYLTQEDRAVFAEADKMRAGNADAAMQQGGRIPDPAQTTPADLQNLSPEQLDALEKRLQPQGQ